MYVGNARSLPSSGAPCFTHLVRGITYIRLGLKSVPGTNTLAYHGNSYITIVKSFVTLGPGVTIKEHFIFVSDAPDNKAKVYEPGKTFKSSIMFVSNVRNSR
jgi:hypothetical protein